MLQQTLFSRALFALALASGFVAVASPAGATYSGSNGPIAWSESGDILVARADGTQPKIYKDGKDSSTSPSISPNGRLIAWTRQPSKGQPYVYVAKLGKSTTTALKPTPQLRALGQQKYIASATPAWSPDGKSIAFRCTIGLASEICRIKVDGAGFRRLTKCNCAYGRESRMDWSKRGLIAFAAGGSIYTVKAGGGSANEILDPQRWAGPYFHSAYRFPSFSPDGKLLLFTQEGGASSSSLVVANADGSGAREIELPFESGGETYFPTQGAFSPDGQRVVAMLSAGRFVLAHRAWDGQALTGEWAPMGVIGDYTPEPNWGPKP